MTSTPHPSERTQPDPARDEAGAAGPVAAHTGSVTQHTTGGVNVAITGVVYGDVNVNPTISSVTGGLTRLQDAHLHPAGVFDAVKVEHFTGRAWLIDQIDTFIASHDRGYVVIEAAAGLGKTTMAAWLAARRGYPCHFTHTPHGDLLPTALRNLAAQLIATYELEKFTVAGDLLPPEAGEPGWFAQLLRAAAMKVAAAGNKLVLVVDGLDEAEPVRRGLPLGLPADLPSGVFVVATCRTGTHLPLALPWTILPIHAEDERNTADVRQFVRNTAAAEPLARLLAEHDFPLERLVHLLTDRCGGVWVYLRYVMDELRYGLRGLEDLETLPADLPGYYTQSLARMREDAGWEQTRLPLLPTLAVVAEPLPVTTLARLAGLSEGLVHALCAERYRPFLSVTTTHQHRSYQIYHASLREFLTGATPPRALEATVGLAEELARAAYAAHARVAESYLSDFGALEAGLPKLADDPGIADRDDGYGLRYLASHLDQAGQVEQLHRLLACERPINTEAARNLWYEAHDRAGSLENYLADLARARRRATHATDESRAAGRQAPTLGLEVRYWLLSVCATTMAARIRPPLLLRLVTAGMWDATRALRYARHLRDPHDRVKAITSLLPDIPPASQAAAHTEALAAATAIPDMPDRARALVGLAPHLPQHQRQATLAQAVAAALATTDKYVRAEVLAGLAPHLPPPHLPPELLRDALAAAQAIPDMYNQAGVLAGLAPHLPPELLHEALTAAQAIPDEPDRARVLAGLAPHLPVDQRRVVLAEALAAARATTEEYLRAELLAELAVGAPVIPRGYAQVIPQAEAPHLPSDQRRVVLAEALAAARAETTESLRAEILAGLAPHLPVDQRRVVLAEALAAARATTEEYLRAEVLVALAPHLPPELLHEALAAAQTVTDESEYSRAEVLAGLAPHLPPELLHEALTAARAIPDEPDRARALAGLAPYLSPELLREALTAARTITDERLGVGERSNRVVVLAELAPHLPPDQRRVVIAEAFTAAQADLDRYSREEALEELASHLPPELLREALTAAQADTQASFLAEDLVGMEPHLPQQKLRPRVLPPAVLPPWEPPPDRPREALASAWTMLDRSLRARVLAGLAPYLSPELLREAWAEAQAITGDPYRARVLAGLAPHLPPEQRQAALAEALAAARATTDEWSLRAEALVGLAPHLPEVLHEALAAVRAITHEWRRGMELAELALYLTAELLDEALTASTSADSNIAILSRAAELSSMGVPLDTVSVMRRCLKVNGLTLADAYKVLMVGRQIIEREGGTSASTSCIEAIRMTQRWFP